MDRDIIEKMLCIALGKDLFENSQENCHSQRFKIEGPGGGLNFL